MPTPKRPAPRPSRIPDPPRASEGVYKPTLYRRIVRQAAQEAAGFGEPEPALRYVGAAVVVFGEPPTATRPSWP